MKKRVLCISLLAAFLTLALACAAFAAELPFKSMKMVDGMGSYLYEAEYEPTTEESYAMLNMICKSLFGGEPLSAPGCTSVRKDNLYGRNFDYFCDKYADIIVRTKAGNGHYASIMLDGGMLGRVLGNTTGNLLCTKDRLDAILAGETTPEEQVEAMWLTYLPYVAMDGFNEKGVVCNINVAQSGKGVGLTTGTNPEAEKEMYVALLPRYILDHCASAKEAVEEIQKFNVWASVTEESPQTEYHIMIADAKNTYIVEFRDNKMLVREISDKPYMTNFNLLLGEDKMVDFDEKGCVVRSTISNYTGSEGDRGNGHGVERYDIIAKGYASVNSKDSLRVLLDKASYGKLYYDPEARFDELVAGNTEMFVLQSAIKAIKPEFEFGLVVWGLTLKAATENAAELCDEYDLCTLLPLVAEAADADRTNIMPIHTIHSCIYDISAGKLWIKSQELGDKEKGAWSKEYCLSPKGSSSSSGCNAGFGALALFGVLGLFYRRNKQ
ncbi:MAG: carcinine hydrolase/isopenicillin-N N-acyltransferase family protein [Synergistaceae bacterium]|nr:carcinine hydrolase/isopenicillin-N N-acyltransferase family protein [Synergistaceae bacterium]